MISERKLRSLKPESRLRKIARILRQLEEESQSGSLPESRVVSFLIGCARELLDTPGLDHSTVSANLANEEVSIRTMNETRHAILRHLDEDPAEWDLLRRSDDTTLPYVADSRFRVYLDDLRSPFNVGSIFRTAAAFGVAEILLSQECASPEHPRATRSSMDTSGIVPWRRVSAERLESELLSSGTPFALETGGLPLSTFGFPSNGIVALGSEELGIGSSCRKIARRCGGIVSIELPGPKASINVSVAFGILIQNWRHVILESTLPIV